MIILKAWIPILIGFVTGCGIIFYDFYITGGGYEQSWVSYLGLIPMLAGFFLRNYFYKWYKK